MNPSVDEFLRRVVHPSNGTNPARNHYLTTSYNWGLVLCLNHLSIYWLRMTEVNHQVKFSDSLFVVGFIRWHNISLTDHPRSDEFGDRSRWTVRNDFFDAYYRLETGLEMVTFCVYGRYIMNYHDISIHNVYQCIPLVLIGTRKRQSGKPPGGLPVIVPLIFHCWFINIPLCLSHIPIHRPKIGFCSPD